MGGASIRRKRSMSGKESKERTKRVDTKFLDYVKTDPRTFIREYC